MFPPKDCTSNCWKPDRSPARSSSILARLRMPDLLIRSDPSPHHLLPAALLNLAAFRVVLLQKVSLLSAVPVGVLQRSEEPGKGDGYALGQ